jgi:Ca2+-binding EF-hand superfamily protein
MKISHLFLSTSLLLGAGLAWAQDAGKPESPQSQRGHQLRALDTNKDKLISREEAKSHAILAKSFDSIDANKDGQLSRDELKNYHAAHKMDQDGDGNISKAEAAKNPKLAENFDKIDTNKDGVITPAERKAWMQANGQRRQKS